MDEFTKLKEWYVADLIKPGIDKFERATIIRSLMNELNISGRELGRRYNIPKSTIEDWLLYNRISEAEYKRLVASGINPKTIYKTLRENKRENIKLEVIDLFLEQTRARITSLATRPIPTTPKTFILIDELIDQLNALSSRLSVRQRKGRA